MGHVGIFESEAHGSDESLVFWRLTGEIFPNEAHFVDSALPAFFLSLS